MPTQPNVVTEGGRNRAVWVSSQIVPKPIDDLIHYDNAVRVHSDKSIGKLADSIAEFGFILPVVVDRTNTVIVGHGRIEAAKRLTMPTVPTICADHLSPAQIKAYRIADNKLAEHSNWNDKALRIELGDLLDLSYKGELDFDVSVTGFETSEIDIRFTTARDNGEEPPETVEVPDRKTTPITRLGDLWVLGRHRILCGNALDDAAHQELLGDEACRMVFTDPPYNVPVNGHVRSGRGGGHREFAMASGEMSEEAFRAFLGAVHSTLFAGLPAGSIAMVFMDWRHIEELISTGKAAGFELINLVTWVKSNGGMGSLYRSRHELVAVFKKPGAPHVNNVQLGKHGRNRTNVWEYAGVNSFGAGREADLADHPTIKPVALVADALMDVSRRGDIVLDPFGGSGSTLLAAERTGRCARLIELDPSYVDVTIRRWQEITGQTAVSAATGEAWDDRADLCVKPEEGYHA